MKTNRNLSRLDGKNTTVMLNLFQHLHLVKAEETLKKFQGDKERGLEGKRDVVNKRCHAELVSASSTQAVLKQQQQASKILNQVQDDFINNTTASGCIRPLSFPKAVIGNPHRFVNKQGGDPRTLRAAKPSGMTSLSGRFQIKFGMTFFNNVASGFTLIELLVVVLIIGILAAVALPQYQKSVEKARLSEATSMLKKLEQATDVWLLENGGYPSSVTNFLGNNPPAQLSFEVEGVKVANSVRTNFFHYNTYCGTNYCDHIAVKVDGTYRLFQRKINTDTYVRQCDIFDTDSRTAHFVCDEMKKQGWSKVLP